MSKKVRNLILILGSIVVFIALLLIFYPKNNYSSNFETNVTIRDSSAENDTFETSVDVKRKGIYVISFSFWQGESPNYRVPGFISGITILDEKGNIVKATSAGALEIEYTPITLEKGKYTLKVKVLSDQKSYDEFCQKYLDMPSSADTIDIFKDGSWQMHYNFKIQQYVGLFIIGLIAGSIFLVAVLMIPILDFARIDKDKTKQYDERQIAMQGKAYKYAFYTILIYFSLIALLTLLNDLPLFIKLPFSSDLLIIFGLLLGIIVFAVTAVMKDAYFSLNDNKNFFITFFSILAFVNLAFGIYHIAHGDIARDNGFTMVNFGNLLFGTAMLVLLISMLLKKIKDRKKN